MRTIEFKGHTFEYNEGCTLSYTWQKGVTSGNPQRVFKCFEDLFCGKDEEYSELLGGSIDDMAALALACVEDLQQAKN